MKPPENMAIIIKHEGAGFHRKGLGYKHGSCLKNSGFNKT